jgi:hypothetical protein
VGVRGLAGRRYLVTIADHLMTKHDSTAVQRSDLKSCDMEYFNRTENTLLVCTNVVQHKITLIEGAKPVRGRNYRVSLFGVELTVPNNTKEGRLLSIRDRLVLSSWVVCRNALWVNRLWSAIYPYRTWGQTAQSHPFSLLARRQKGVKPRIGP